ncbi:MAG: histone deacetylase [Solirubrobacteraceae bacterium]
MAAPVLVHHPSSLRHDTGSHPERAERIVAIEEALAAEGWLGYERAESPAAGRGDLEAVHPARHVSRIEELAARGGGLLDPDTVVSEHSFEAARHAAGGALLLAELLVTGASPTGFSIHRPPGHHAEAARAMGFCLFNSVAVAARHALDRHGVERVMVLDWDVHHGNGTNDIFHAGREVLFVSIHQSPLYPGTGGAGDVGEGEGRGYTVNLPVPPGAGDEAYRSLVEHVVVPLGRAYQPRLILLSAGFDAHRDDPLADARVTEGGFAAMAAAMSRLGAETGAPVGAVLEGGYDLGALSSSVVATMRALAAGPRAGADEVPLHPLAAGARRLLEPFWPELAGE